MIKNFLLLNLKKEKAQLPQLISILIYKGCPIITETDTPTSKQRDKTIDNHVDMLGQLILKKQSGRTSSLHQ